jgi:hypothetical protein
MGKAWLARDEAWLERCRWLTAQVEDLLAERTATLNG